MNSTPGLPRGVASNQHPRKRVRRAVEKLGPRAAFLDEIARLANVTRFGARNYLKAKEYQRTAEGAWVIRDPPTTPPPSDPPPRVGGVVGEHDVCAYAHAYAHTSPHSSLSSLSPSLPKEEEREEEKEEKQATQQATSQSAAERWREKRGRAGWG